MRIFVVCFIFVLFNLKAISDFPTIDLKDIDITKYQIVRVGVERGATRTIYVAAEEGLFFKIWDKNFWRCPYFLQGLKNGFYDENNTPLVAIIYDKGNCRGYVTRAGLQVSLGLTNGKYVFLPIKQQKDQAYIDFYNDLIERTKLLDYVYVDLNPTNLVLEDNKIKIIDLEPLLPLSKVGPSFFNDKAFPSDYRSYIKRLKDEKSH